MHPNHILVRSYCLWSDIIESLGECQINYEEGDIMKKYNNYVAVLLACATCLQITACGLSDIRGLSDITGIDKETIDDVSEKLDKGKEIISKSSEGLSTFKETAEDINEFADEASSFVSQVAEDIDAKGIIGGIKKTTGKESDSAASNGILKSAADINLSSADGGTKDYTFVYGGETFNATHTADHWTIYDSYRINSKSDMMIICQALIDLYPVHGSDMVSYRTAEDMTIEWQQHNIGFIILKDQSEMASHLKDVDFDPADQGKSFDQIYKDRTGKEFKFSDFLSD